MADFSSDSLSNNPNFDFVKILSQIHADDENKSDFVSSDSPYDLSEILCTYMSETELICHPKFFVQPSVLSINIQSLSAKFAEFRESILSFLVITMLQTLFVCKKFGEFMTALYLA